MFVYAWLMCSLVRCLTLCCCVPRQKVHTGDVGPSLDSNRIVSPKLQPQARQRLHFLLVFFCLFGVALNLGRSKASGQILYSTHYVIPSLTKIPQYISRTSRKFNCGFYFDGDVHYVAMCGTRTALRMLPLLLPNDLRPGRYVHHACKTCPPAVLRLMVLRALAQWR